MECGGAGATMEDGNLDQSPCLPPSGSWHEGRRKNTESSNWGWKRETWKQMEHALSGSRTSTIDHQKGKSKRRENANINDAGGFSPASSA